MSFEKSNTLETLTKLITIFTVIFYLTGVFTVNSYLYHLGISSLSSPLKPRFIYTGIVVLASLGFSFFFPWFFIRIFLVYRLKFRWFYTLFITLIPLIVYLFVNYLFVVLVNNPGVIVLAPGLSIIIVFYYYIGSYITGSVISLFVQAFFPNFTIRAGINYWRIQKNKSIKFLTSFLLIPFLSSYITFFGYRIYPLIPEQFGGGQPRIIVQLWLKKEVPEDLRKTLKIENNPTAFTSSSPTTLAILFDEGKYYLLGLYTEKPSKKIMDGETKDGKILESIVQIDRSLVLGINLTKDSSKYSLSYF